MSEKLKRIIAIAVASLGIFAFAACNTDEEKGNSTENETEQGTGGGTETDDPTGGSGTGGGTADGSGTGTGSGTGSGTGTGTGGGTAEIKPPVIPTVPAGSVKITEAAGDLEAAYVIWDKVEGAMGYNVYVKGESGDYTQLDAPLVREYPDYFRADAVGLKAGQYSFKVVPTGGAELVEDTSKEATVNQITVLAHERSGYAFVGGSSSGAYNDDGTLKANANVIYVTDENKDNVPLEMYTGTVYGIQNILDTQKKEGKPLAIRLIGSVSAPDITESKAQNNNKNPNTLLIKGDGKNGDIAVTLEGIGSDATANGWTLRITSATDVEIRNIGFMNTQASEPDGVTLEKDNHIWVHNCDIFYGGAGGDSDQAKGDGALDTKESTYITHSYNHFWDSGKSNLQNMHETGDWRITYHHNWYDHSDSRHPRIRSATVHIYNNYFDGNSKYGVGVTEGASAFVENNYFRSTATMKPMMSSKQGTDLANAEGGNPDNGTFSKEDGGMIKAYGNTFDGKYSLITQNDTADKTNLDCYLASSRNETVSSEYTTKYGGTVYNNFDTAADFYEYTVDSPEVAKEKVEKYAGRVGGGDFKWEFDDETEDSNSSLITELKNALTNYKCPLISAGGIEIGTPDSGSSGEGGGSTEGGTTGGTEGGTTGGAIEGEITFIPSSSGNGFTVTGSTKSHSEIVVAGVTVPKNSALKLDSSGKIEFTLTESMNLYLYVLNDKTVAVDGENKTPSAEGGYYVITLTLSAGEHTISKGGSENSVYLIKLVPNG